MTTNSACVPLNLRTKSFLLGVSNETKNPKATSAKLCEQVGQVQWWVVGVPVPLYFLLTYYSLEALQEK